MIMYMKYSLMQYFLHLRTLLEGHLIDFRIILEKRGDLQVFFIRLFLFSRKTGKGIFQQL